MSFPIARGTPLLLSPHSFRGYNSSLCSIYQGCRRDGLCFKWISSSQRPFLSPPLRPQPRSWSALPVVEKRRSFCPEPRFPKLGVWKLLKPPHLTAVWGLNVAIRVAEMWIHLQVLTRNDKECICICVCNNTDTHDLKTNVFSLRHKEQLVDCGAAHKHSK